MTIISPSNIDKFVQHRVDLRLTIESRVIGQLNKLSILRNKGPRFFYENPSAKSILKRQRTSGSYKLLSEIYLIGMKLSKIRDMDIHVRVFRVFGGNEA